MNPLKLQRNGQSFVMETNVMGILKVNLLYIKNSTQYITSIQYIDSVSALRSSRDLHNHVNAKCFLLFFLK